MDGSSSLATAPAPAPVYTQDWAAPTRVVLADIRAGTLAALPDGDVMEIGCFEGRTTNDLAATFPHALVHCVDPFYDGHFSVLHIDVTGQHQRFVANTAAIAHRLRVHRGFSQDVVPTLTCRLAFAYIDGDHSAAAVERDADMVWPLLLPGGMLLFDDYLWLQGDTRVPEEAKPRLGIDAWLAKHCADAVVLRKEYQVLVRKQVQEQTALARPLCSASTSHLNFLTAHARSALQRAMDKRSALSAEVLAMEGMSGRLTRHFYNNLCSLGYCKYLEVGSWKGSSFVSAMYMNRASGICVDNWTQFGGPKAECLANYARFLTHGEEYRVVEKSCWELTPADVAPGSIDIYMYDGEHTPALQQRAITAMKPFLASQCIIVVDDWVMDCWGVRSGTLAGCEEAGLRVHALIEIPLVGTTALHQQGDTFWNGCGVLICEKIDATAA